VKVPQLLIHPDAETIANQIDSWGAIVQLSEKIRALVNDMTSSAERNWQDLMNLADQRDKLVEDFFNKGVCQLLLPQINDDLVRIKKQHLDIMMQLREREHATKKDEDFLRSAKEQITQMMPRSG